MDHFCIVLRHVRLPLSFSLSMILDVGRNGVVGFNFHEPSFHEYIKDRVGSYRGAPEQCQTHSAQAANHS